MQIGREQSKQSEAAENHVGRHRQRQRTLQRRRLSAGLSGASFDASFAASPGRGSDRFRFYDSVGGAVVPSGTNESGIARVRVTALSAVAAYGVMDTVRQLFARANKVAPSQFMAAGNYTGTVTTSGSSRRMSSCLLEVDVAYPKSKEIASPTLTPSE